MQAEVLGRRGSARKKLEEMVKQYVLFALALALAHGAVDVGRWGGALAPGFTAEALAADVGRAVGQLVS